MSSERTGVCAGAGHARDIAGCSRGHGPLLQGIIGAALLFFFIGHAHAAITLTDAAGQRFTLSTPAKRVISLAPSLTEMVFAAGGGDSLIGVMSYSDFPAAARSIPRVADASHFDLERIAQLKPDLILGWQHGNPAREIERLRALGLPLFMMEPRRMEDVPRGLEDIGRLLGSESTANAAAHSFRERLAALSTQYAGKRKLRVFYQIARQPLLTINGEHLITDVLTLCGGENVFARLPALVPQISTESVLAADPQVIMSSYWDAAGNEQGGPEGPRHNAPGGALSMWRRFTGLRAVREDNLWTISADWISRNGPRILDGAQAVCEALEAARH